MSRLETVLSAVIKDLSASGIPCALVGGLAVSARTDPRFTRDVDLAVSVDTDRQAEAVVNQLLECGYSVLASLEQTAVGRLATVRLRSPAESAEGIVIDLLFASSGIEREVVAQADLVGIVPGLVVPVARLAHLIALKLLARDAERRPQDDQDLSRLLVLASQTDIDQAREAISLIRSRGFHRGKDLGRDFEDLLVRFRGNQNTPTS